MLALVLIPLLMAGCAKAKMYSGPARPASELSTVYFHAGPQVTLSALTFDGKRTASSTGYSALPDRHSYSVNYHLDHARPTTSSGTCSGDFTSEAGKEYIIDVTGGDAASVSVYTDGRRVLVTSGDCR